MLFVASLFLTWPLSVLSDPQPLLPYTLNSHQRVLAERRRKMRMPKQVLTEAQKELIRQTWHELEGDMSTIGTLVFLRIFNQNPKLKVIFPFRNNWGNDLVTHPAFSRHSYRSVITFSLLLSGHSKYASSTKKVKKIIMNGLKCKFFHISLNCIFYKKSAQNLAGRIT